jgi:Protein of unknown function (DUF4232)
VRIALVAALLAVLTAPAAGRVIAGVPLCRGSQLSATFTVIPGSRGAGNVGYALRLQSRSPSACFVSGLPKLQLLERTGLTLPTRVRAESPRALTAVRVVVKPGSFASASARFTPDVPGPGESGPRCEPTAYRVRVTVPPGGGTTLAAVQPPTPVCVHGSMTMSVLVAGRKPPHA